MNSKDLTSSTPYTIQNYDNYLKDYINTSGFKWDSSCLDVVFTNLGNNFSNYVNKVGDYNTVTATNPQYTPPRSYQEKDYNQPCPEGWTSQWWTGGCVNPNYTGPCENVAGRTQKKPRAARCPTNRQPSTITSGGSWKWNWWRPGWQWQSNTVANNNFYTGWNGPTDAGQKLARTNIGSKNSGEGSYCTAGWARSNSLGGAAQDCAASGGQWVNYWDDPGFWRNGYTCYTPTQYDWVTENSSWFGNSTNEQKRNWENSCQAYWQMRTVNIPGRWTCTYGVKIEDDIARGNIFQIGIANSSLEAARLVLRSNRMIDNYYFMIGNEVYITGPNSNVGVFTSKGFYEKNCTEQNNRMGTLYLINNQFFNMLEDCKRMNNSLNNLNETRAIVQNSVSSVREKFIGGSRNSDIIEHLVNEDILKNQNEISANLISNYNKKAELYNYQVGLLGQNDKLIEDHNKKLNTQLDELSQIQDQIALKDRVIELNDELSRKQIRNKKILIGFFILIPFLGIPLLLVVSKAFSPFIGIGMAVLFIIGYIIYIIVVANQKDVKNFGKENKNVISKYEKAIANYWNKQKEKLQNSLNNFVNEKCANSELPENKDSGIGSGSSNSAYPKRDYLMKSNGPFYYYDGSAPPQQIYPGAIGSIEFNIEGENYKFPKGINDNLKYIKNPITKFFFQTWLSILNKNGIKLDDPRFSEVLDVIDFPDSDQTPMPFWDNIKLPIVTNINQQFNYLFQSYSGEKRNLSQTASVLLVDLWNFIFGDKIPGDVYERWVKSLADIVKQPTPNIEKFYEDYLKELITSTKFTDKYGSGDAGLARFVEIKMVDFIKTFNQDINVSQPFAKKYVP